jgi:hypothetical protein
MGIKELFSSPVALQEFGLLIRGIQPIMTDVNSTVEEKRTALNQLVNELSEKTFKNDIVVNQIMIIINMKKEECEKFSSTDAQVNSILTWLPRMAIHREKLAKKVEHARKSFGLNLEEELLEYE